MKNISIKNNELMKSIITTRRDLHQMPEEGLKELKTQEYIIAFLEKLKKVEYKKIAGTGIIAYFKADNDTEETIGFRCDIDALEMKELTEHEFKSKHEGFMHACGHDGHMSVMLNFAKVLSEGDYHFNKNVAILFQPAEEGPGGAEIIIKEGILKEYNIKEIYGLHLHPDVLEGRFATKSGAFMATAVEFDIDITGKSGHGAMPHTGVDSVIICCELITKLQNIVSRALDPVDPAVITVGKMEAGERRNIIAHTARLEGTIRAFDEKIVDAIYSKINAYMKGMEIEYGCSMEMDFRRLYPPVVNSEELLDVFVKAVGQENVDSIRPQMISEDFSYYQKDIPGLFVFLGVRNEEKGHTIALHNAKFDFDEEVLFVGIEAFVKVLLQRDAIEIK